MTEEEAQNKWCPMARSIIFEKPEGGAHASGNRIAFDGESDSDCCCLGSGCAMWRWNAYKALKNRSTGELVPFVAGQALSYANSTIVDAYSTTEGYCGLGGKP